MLGQLYGHAQRRQSAKLFLQSSELRLPQPLTRRRVCPPPPGSGGRGTLADESWGWESPDDGTYTVVLFMYVRTLCCHVTVDFPSNDDI